MCGGLVKSRSQSSHLERSEWSQWLMLFPARWACVPLSPFLPTPTSGEVNQEPEGIRREARKEGGRRSCKMKCRQALEHTAANLTALPRAP